MLKMSDLQSLVTHILQFRDDREWKQFHNVKDLAQFLLLYLAIVYSLYTGIGKKEKNKLMQPAFNFLAGYRPTFYSLDLSMIGRQRGSNSLQAVLLKESDR